MKMIAQEADIAVGTLYNYYDNKKELFLEVLEKSWQETFNKIDQIINSQKDIVDKINHFIATLYDEIVKRRGIGNELIKEDVFKRQKLESAKAKSREQFKSLISELRKEQEVYYSQKMESRMADTILLTTVNLINEYKEEREKNIKFLKELIDIT